MGFAILRVQKLKSPVAVQRSMKHAHREQDTPNADSARTPDNTYIGPQSVDEGMAAFNARLPAKFRKDAVQAIEYLVTGSPEVLNAKDRAAQDAYFDDALTWLRKRHGAENVVAVGIHRDETTPHLYAIVVPRDGEKLNAKKWLGGAGALRGMQSEFAETVAKRHGLERGIEGSKATHKAIRQHYAELQTGERLAEQQASITPVDLVPQRSKADGLFGKIGLASNVETPEMVAHRITERMRPLAAQVIQLERENTALKTENGKLRQQVTGLRAELVKFGELVKGLVSTQLDKLKAMANQFRQDNERDRLAQRDAEWEKMRAVGDLRRAAEAKDRQEKEASKGAETKTARGAVEQGKTVKEFDMLADRRRLKFHGYDDKGSHWNALPAPLRRLIDDYNGMTETAKATVKATPENLRALLDQRQSRGLSR